MNLVKSNLYQLFLSLSPDEVKILDKAVHSPFFNYRTEEINLFQLLKTAIKSKQTELSGETVCAQLFPNQTADLNKLRHVMTYLTRIIYRVIIISETEQNEAQTKLLLTTALRKRKLDKLFLATYEDARVFIEEQAPLSPQTYYHQLQLHTEYYAHSIADRKAKNEDLQKLSTDLDLYYIIQKLKHGCNILSYKNIFKFEHQPDLIQELQVIIEKKDMLGNPLVRLLYYNYLCLSEPENETHFIQLKQNLLTKNNHIETAELRDIFTLAINYCIKRLNTGGQKYYQEVFEIYQAGLRENVFEENGTFSPFTYKNISAIAIRLKEYKWVKTFIENYKNKLSEEQREGFHAYCLARYYFAIGDFQSAETQLREVDIKEQFTDLDARVLLIKTYYELDEYNLLTYSIENLKQQLKRKNIQSYHQTVYGNFASISARLLRLGSYDKKAKDTFRKKIQSLTSIAEKDWLLEKV